MKKAPTGAFSYWSGRGGSASALGATRTPAEMPSGKLLRIACLTGRGCRDAKDGDNNRAHDGTENMKSQEVQGVSSCGNFGLQSTSQNLVSPRGSELAEIGTMCKDSVLKKLRELPHPISSLASILGGTVQGHDEILIKTQDVILPIYVQIGETGIQFRVRNIEETDYEANCLILDVNLQKKIARLSWLAAENRNCQVPKDNMRGKFFLRLADELSKAVGATVIDLVDDSKKKCQKNGQSTSLQLLALMQSGRSWYENDGYKPVKSDAPETSLEGYADIVKRLKYKSLSAAISDVGAPSEKRAKDFEKLKAKAEEFSKSKKSNQDSKGESAGPMLSEFLKWLWNDDCRVYISSVKLFSEKRGSELSSDLIAIAGLSMRKRLSEDCGK